MNDYDHVIALAARVSEALERAGIEAVLSGGAAVQIYSRARYVSKDLDFVTSASHRDLKHVLAEIGFVPSRSRRLFTSESSDYLVEFPASPLAVGNELIHSWARLETDHGSIQILTPTQSIKDRLAAYIHWNDHQAFDQAVEIAVQRTDIDMQSIRDWTIGEQDLATFEQFEGRVKQRQRI